MAVTLCSSSLRRYLSCFMGMTSFAILLMLCSGTGAAAADKQAAGGGEAKHGALLFQKQCMGCHNKQVGDTSPFGPPNLHGVFGSKPLVTPHEATEIIREGKGAMPSFKTRLSDSDIDDLIAYLKTQ